MHKLRVIRIKPYSLLFFIENPVKKGVLTQKTLAFLSLL